LVLIGGLCDEIAGGRLGSSSSFCRPSQVSYPRSATRKRRAKHASPLASAKLNERELGASSTDIVWPSARRRSVGFRVHVQTVPTFVTSGTWIGVLVLLVVAVVFARSAAKRRAERQRAEAVEARQEARALEQRAAERERTAEDELARAERERAATRGHAQRADEVDPDIET
jgi:hypothetical protein